MSDIIDAENTPADDASLVLAAKNGDSTAVGSLLKQGANPNAIDEEGETALHGAAVGDYHGIVKVLLEAGADVLAKRPPPEDDFSMMSYTHPREAIYLTPLGSACKLGHVEAVREMVPYLRTQYIEMSLQLAIEFMQLALAEFLIQSTDLNIKSQFGGELLLTAASKADVKMMQLLISSGVDHLYRRDDPRKSFMQGSIPDIVDSSLLVSICGGSVSRRVRSLEPNKECFQQAVEFAIDAGCDVNTTGHMDRTALHWAVSSELPVIDKLLEHGANVNARDKDGNTPLHLLYPSETTKDTMETLTRHGARWDAVRDSDGKTPLHTSVESRQPDLDLNLLKPFIEDWNVKDSRGNTPLHLLANSFIPADRSKRLIEQLIALGADVNLKNDNGQTPVQELDPVNMASIGPLFLAAGADLEERDNKGRTWFLRSIRSDNDLRNRTLRAAQELNLDIQAVDNEGNNALHLVCSRNESLTNTPTKNIIQCLITAGVDPRHVNSNGDTLFHILMAQSFQGPSSGFIPKLELLRAANVPILAQNNRGETLLHCAMSVRLDVFYRDLLYPAKNPLALFSDDEISTMIRMPDIQSRFPVHIAATTEESFVWWLITRGADITVCTNDGRTPLHMAADSGKSNTIGLLLEMLEENERCAAVDQKDIHGRTPLHYACRSGSLESVRLLLDAGGDAAVVDNEQRTLLHACAEFEKSTEVPAPRHGFLASSAARGDEGRASDIVHILLRHGAGIMEKDKTGKTAIGIACDAKNEEIVMALMDAIRSREGQVGFESLETQQRDYIASIDLKVKSLLDEMLGDEKSKASIPWTCDKLLALGAQSAIEDLAGRAHLAGKLGSFTPLQKDFLETLVQNGLVELFERLGLRRRDNTWINGSLSSPPFFSDSFDIRPFIITAALRSEPSLHLLSSIVEPFEADMNVTIVNSAHRDACAFHILAGAKHWWHTDGVKYLLQRGADPNVLDGLGQSALHFAVNGGYRRLGIVELLLQRGADPNIRDYEGMTPITQTVGDLDILRLLVDNGADITAGRRPILYTAIEACNVETVRAVVEVYRLKGIDLNRPFREKDYTEATDPPAHYHTWKDELAKLHLRPLELATMERPRMPMPSIQYDKAKLAAIAQLLVEYGLNL
ncbi:ankyrin repeat-containing domain protein [Aspergillus unguis]